MILWNKLQMSQCSWQYRLSCGGKTIAPVTDLWHVVNVFSQSCFNFIGS